MKTIVEPMDNIMSLWGAQTIDNSATYRVLKYTLKLDVKGKMLLLNVVTGQLVVLDEDEALLLDNCPHGYTPIMDELINSNFLVEEHLDEHLLVVGLREVLAKLKERDSPKEITHYTILPTTACNARCYYCFEQGCKTETMTASTADDVVGFIKRYSGGKHVRITWFGGEPTVASHIITQISKGLSDAGISYHSEMTTNGYLLDKEMIKTSQSVWHLRTVMICLDGTENGYNTIKSYVGAKESPYRRVLNNIDELAKEGVAIHLRVNFDIDNYDDCKVLLVELSRRYKDTATIMVSAHPINGEYADNRGVVHHGDDKWFEEKVVELNDIASRIGLRSEKPRLFHLDYSGCQASNRSSETITPSGNLVRCPEQFEIDQVTGNIWDGVTNVDLVQEWKRIADCEKCVACPLLPICMRVYHCSTSDLCRYKLRYFKMGYEAMSDAYKASEYSSWPD